MSLIPFIYAVAVSPSALGGGPGLDLLPLQFKYLQNILPRQHPGSRTVKPSYTSVKTSNQVTPSHMLWSPYFAARKQLRHRRRSQERQRRQKRQAMNLDAIGDGYANFMGGRTR